MNKGFYNLTSGILSQSRRLDTVGNNMTNITTPGYKQEIYTDTTFDEVLISRIGNKDKQDSTPLGQESYILAPSELYVDYSRAHWKRPVRHLISPSRAMVFSPSKRQTVWNTPATDGLCWMRKATCACRSTEECWGRTAHPSR